MENSLQRFRAMNKMTVQFAFFLRNCGVAAIECTTTVGITFTKEHGRSGLPSPEKLGVGFGCTCDPTLPSEGHQEAGRGEGIC